MWAFSRQAENNKGDKAKTALKEFLKEKKKMKNQIKNSYTQKFQLKRVNTNSKLFNLAFLKHQTFLKI